MLCGSQTTQQRHPDPAGTPGLLASCYGHQILVTLRNSLHRKWTWGATHCHLPEEPKRGFSVWAPSLLPHRTQGPQGHEPHLEEHQHLIYCKDSKALATASSQQALPTPLGDKTRLQGRAESRGTAVWGLPNSRHLPGPPWRCEAQPASLPSPAPGSCVSPPSGGPKA